MNTLEMHKNDYLAYCQCQKRLDSKTLKAYRIDLTQFITQVPARDIFEITPKFWKIILPDFIKPINPKP